MEEKFNKLIKWIKPPPQLKSQKPFLKAIPIKPVQNNKILYQVETGSSKKQVKVSINDSFQMSFEGKSFDDMCHMTILNQPQVLNNIIERYKKQLIFTYIGPTLIVLNPYQYFSNFFDDKAMLSIRQKIINENFQNDQPHIYMIAGKAYHNIMKSQNKQAIVISGQSGAGKTQSTKYCMKILTSLSHLQSHSIEAKILSCNPILQAFGNSKTVRNDNSSRFGKYVQMFFGKDNTIKGANIRSYLLEKSRVVSIAKGQRTFHAFYALTSSKKFNVKPAEEYQFLKQSDCYQANNINDSKYFDQINESMKNIDFNQQQQEKIWMCLKAILQLGNIKFNNKKNKQDQEVPCQIVNKELLKSISHILEISEQGLQKVLLFQRKLMVKQIMTKAFKIQGCIGHRNTLCKAIYNTIFQFILYKIQTSLNSKEMHHYKSINILDIFGFQNFQSNSFQQLCINFTNQKLLKLYNQYIFKRQMQLLSEDGLQEDIKSIKPPTNDEIISLMNTVDLKSVSIFSIVNDNTDQQYCTDLNIKQSIEKQFKNSNNVKFNLTKPILFTIKHSQCDVQYNVEGFKLKNLDKVNDDILEIVNNCKVFKASFKSKQQKISKTLLKKFSLQIDTLISELSSSNVHFVRCIKPNQVKKPNFPVQNYILSQVRYLGVFQTIQIRKKTFPVRKDYIQFTNEYKMIFSHIHFETQNHRKITEGILKQLKCQNNQFLLGHKRVYINERIQGVLNKKLYEYYKKRNELVKKVQEVCKRFVFRSKVSRKVKQLLKRKHMWIKIAISFKVKLQKTALQEIRRVYLNKKEQQKKKIKQLDQKTVLEEQKKKLSKPISKETSSVNEISPQKANKPINLSQKSIKKLQSINQKFFKYSKFIIKAHVKLSMKKYLEKLKIVCFFQGEGKNSKLSQLNTINETILVQPPQKNPSIHKLKGSISNAQKIDQNKKYKQQTNKKQEYNFNESFYNEQSVYISPGADIIFTGNLKIQMYQKNSQTIEKLNLLKTILAQKYKSIYSAETQLCSPHSEDSFFKIQQAPQVIMNKIINFPIDDFFQRCLRKRTGVFGIKKDYSQILSFKPRPLTKTLTQLNNEEQNHALKVFKLLIKIGQQTVLDNVFKLVDNVMRYCQQTSQTLKNQIFLQLIKQSNNESQVPAIRIYQTFSVFLHIYTPDQDFVYAALYLFFNKIAQKKYRQKQEQFLRYLFKKMIRKIQKPHGVGYMPIKYQIMALMSKRQISIPIYLPIGNNILVKAESYQTFGDIKEKVLQQLGINTKRVPIQFFAFFEVVNYENTELEQSPVNQNSVIWDVMTYWQLAKEKYQESGVPAPYFSIMVKIKYPYECSYDDQQTIQLYFAQCYFDYSMGRIRLELKQMSMLAACIKKIKLPNQSNEEIEGCFPLWISKIYDKETFKKCIIDNLNWLEDNHLEQLTIKYKFLQVCSQSALSMTFAIPTQHSIKLFLKPKRIYLVEKGNVVGQYSIRQIAKWSNNNESFNFEVKKKDGTVQNKTHIIMTQYSHMCTQYLNKVSQLLLKYGGRNKKSSQNSILKGI